MPSNCFVCLKSTRNRVCRTCRCSAHPRCWGEYVNKSSLVLTYLFPSKVLVTSPLSVKCPECRGRISTVKPVTRSDTAFARYVALISEYITILDELAMAGNSQMRDELLHELFRDLVSNHQLLKGTSINEAVRQRLIDLYRDQNWKAANLYYLSLFGSQIPGKCGQTESEI